MTRNVLMAVLAALLVQAIGRCPAGAAPVAGAGLGTRPVPASTAPQSRADYIQELREIAATLSRKHHVSLLVDPSVVAASKPSAPPKGATLHKALDGLVSALQKASWRRIHLQRGPGSAMPEAWRLAEWVRGLDRLARIGMVVEDTTTGKATVLMREYPVSKGYRDELARAQYKAIYIIYSTSYGASGQEQADTKPAQGPAAIGDVLGDMLGAFFALDQDGQREGMQQAMSLLWGLEPAARTEFVTQLWTSMTPLMQKEMIRVVMQAGLPIGGDP